MLDRVLRFKIWQNCVTSLNTCWITRSDRRWQCGSFGQRFDAIYWAMSPCSQRASLHQDSWTVSEGVNSSMWSYELSQGRYASGPYCICLFGMANICSTTVLSDEPHGSCCFLRCIWVFRLWFVTRWFGWIDSYFLWFRSCEVPLFLLRS